MSSDGKRRLSSRAVAREVAAAYRAHWFFLIVAALIVLLPQTLADNFLDHLEVHGIHRARDLAVLAAVPLTVVVNLFGQAFYAGLTAAAVIEWREHRPLPNMRALLRTVPLGRLALLDMVLTLGTAIGFVLLIIPGLIWLGYFSLSPALVKFEHRGVWGSLRRSREIVRGNFWPVFGLVVGTIAVTEIAVNAVTTPFGGHGIGSILAELGADGLLQPIEGLVIAVTALKLLELRGELPESAELARSIGDVRE